MTEADEMAGNFLASVDVVGEDVVGVQVPCFADHVVAQDDVRNALVIEQLEKIRGGGSGENHGADYIAMLDGLGD